ncbi:MAG TPA: hypothetical protein VGD14_08960 [bacterium]
MANLIFLKENNNYSLQLSKAHFFEAGFISCRYYKQFWYEVTAVISMALLIVRHDFNGRNARDYCHNQMS